MYHSLKSFFAFIFLLMSFVFANSLSAEEAKVGSATASPTQSQAILLADVSIYNAKIEEQSGSSFKIYFELANGIGSQAGVKYSIKFISASKDGKQTVANEKVFDEEISLPQNSTIKKDITYTAPGNLDGKYSVFLSANNESGFPLGVASLGEVTLKAVNKGLEIDTNSCFLNVENEKGSPKYTLSQGVDIGYHENLILSCSVLNTTKKSITLSPTYEMTALSTFGDIVGMYDTDSTAFSLKSNEKKIVSLKMPKSPFPKMYVTKVGFLSNETGASNTVLVSYMLRGVNANIQNASLDKDQYNSGESATLSLIWSSRTGGTRLAANALSSIVTAETKLTDGNGKMCAETLTSELKYEPGAPFSKISLPVKNQCHDPKLEITLLGAQKEKLDNKVFTFKTFTPEQELAQKNNPDGKKPFGKKGIIALAILAALAILGIVMKFFKKSPKEINKVDGTPSAVNTVKSVASPANKILPVLFFLIVFSLFMPKSNISAATYYVEGLIINANITSPVAGNEMVTVATTVQAANIYPCASNYNIDYINFDSGTGMSFHVLDNNSNTILNSFSGNSITESGSFLSPKVVTSSITRTGRFNIWATESGVWCTVPQGSGTTYFQGSHILNGGTGSPAGTPFSRTFGNNDMTISWVTAPATPPSITSFQPNKGRSTSCNGGAPGSPSCPISPNETGIQITSTATNVTSCTLSPAGTGPSTQICPDQTTCLLNWPISIGSTTQYNLTCSN